MPSKTSLTIKRFNRSINRLFRKNFQRNLPSRRSSNINTSILSILFQCTILNSNIHLRCLAPLKRQRHLRNSTSNIILRLITRPISLFNSTFNNNITTLNRVLHRNTFRINSRYNSLFNLLLVRCRISIRTLTLRFRDRSCPFLGI